MESLDALNLRANECSFLEIALADVRRHVETVAPENEKKQVVLVFPPLNARNRFLIHTLIHNFFNELNTISVGSSYGRRTVVYHRSLKPMSCETELDNSKKIQNDMDTSMERAYRTPCERKAQEKLFDSLIPKKTEVKSSRSTQPPRKQSRRPDIPIYVPKARRMLANNTLPSINCTSNSSNSTPTYKFDPVSKVQLPSNDKIPLCIEKTKCIAPESFKCVDLTRGEITFDDSYGEIQTLFNDVPCNIKILSSGNLPNILNSCNLNSSTSGNIIEKTNIVENVFDNCDEWVEKCLYDNCNTICVQNSKVADMSDFQTLQNSNEKRITDNLQVFQKLENVEELVKPDDNLGKTVKENFSTFEEKQNEISSDQVEDCSSPEKELITEYNSNCPHYCLDDSFASESLIDIEEKNSNNAVEELIDTKKSSEITNESSEIVKSSEKENLPKIKNKKKKKIMDLDECCWEDLYDKEEDYVHPLLMKEIVSTIGKVQIKCTKEDYRTYQTIEERSGDGECVIEVYGFSSDLKTVDLMNQFAGFRKNHLEIIWVNDTHALAVFESPNLADRALNTTFALVKTRPLKNAIKESKLKAESVTPLPATRPKTCTAMARRLVSSALGLKMDLSSDRLHAERTLLANAKEKKIRDAQQKHNIWNDA